MSARHVPALRASAGVAGLMAGWSDQHADWFAEYVNLGNGRNLPALVGRLRELYGADAPSLRTLERVKASDQWARAVSIITQERANAALVESLGMIADNAQAAVSRLVDLLDAETVLISPLGDFHTVADNGLRLRAAESLLDRLGLSKQGRVNVQHSGPDGGPIPVAAVSVTLDLSDKTPGELAVLLREQLAARAG